MRTKATADLIHKLGLEYGLTDSQMRELVESQFKYLRNVIWNGSREDVEYDNFRLANIGIFYVSEARKEFERKRFQNKEEEDEQNNSTGGAQ